MRKEKKEKNSMRQDHKDDKLFLAENDTDICEGYVRYAKRYDLFPKRSRMLAIAFGHEGKVRICNAIGYMKPLTEVDSLDKLPEAAAGEYNFIAAYYVAEHLDDGELTLMIQHIKGLLLAGGSLMVVVNLKEEKNVMDRVKHVCEEQGLHLAHRDFWRSEPLNHWDRLTDKGHPMVSWMQRIPLLRRRMACSVSMLFTEGSIGLKQN